MGAINIKLEVIERHDNILPLIADQQAPQAE